MGYNQHHAGMHLIRYSQKYAPYDDLEYYDELAKRQRNTEKNIRTSETPSVLTETSSKSDKPTEHPQKKDMQKTMSNEKTRPKQKKKKEVSLIYKSHTNITYGTEAVIDTNHYLGISYIVPANIMMIALQKKLDIYEIMDECEKLAASDKYLNPNPEYLYQCSKVERSLVFMSLLAEKMQCSVYQFFINDSESRRQFVYSLLNDLQDDLWTVSKDCINEETGDAEFIVSQFDYIYGMAEKINYKHSQSMDLTVSKNKFSSDKIFYALGFGCLDINYENDNDFMHKGAYIWEEEEGKLRDYVEHLIDLCEKMN